VPASAIARQHLGRPLPNAALLGGFAAMTGTITLESVVMAIRQKFPKAIAEKNVAATTEAFGIATRSIEAAHA
jgi:pyruvate ferredoxin oxidoreductase gamma subunit